MFRGKSAYDWEEGGGGGGVVVWWLALCDIPIKQIEQSNITVLNGFEFQSKSYKLP